MKEVLLGYELASGEPVMIPIAHTFVTGQTQLSGKTTTLRAIVTRSERRALAFITKRGEQFEGRRIKPYLPREGDRPIHWRLVETILASALGQRAMKYERYWIVNAAKGAKSLEDVRRNVSRLGAKAKGATAETYELIGEYLDLVLPEMRELDASHTLDLQPGLNVMDLAGAGQQLQAMVIRACLEQINQHESNVLTVFPEAWEFAPRGRMSPATTEAQAMARKGAVLGNFLLCDSQDIAGVDTVIRQAASVWILGVQRELNELKRTLSMIPASIKKPKIEDITSLEVGQFVACWGRHAVRTYVQPAWMADVDAIDISLGYKKLKEVAVPAPRPSPVRPARLPGPFLCTLCGGPIYGLGIGHTDGMFHGDCFNRRQAPVQEIYPSNEEDVMTQAQEEKLDRILNHIEHGHGPKAAVNGTPATPPSAASVDEEELYQRFKDRLQREAPALLKVLAKRPELEIEIEPTVIKADGASLRGRIARLIAAGFLDDGVTGQAVINELGRLGYKAAVGTVYSELATLAELGFLFVETGKDARSRDVKKFVTNKEAKVHIVQK